MNPYDREILRLAVPSIVTNVTVPLLGLVDLAIVGHIGNETMIGAIAVGSMVFNVMYWLLGFLRMGTSGLTAQEYGRGGGGRLLLILRQTLRLALLIALGMVVLQVPLRWLSLWLMRPSAEVAALVRTYFNICIWGAPAMLSLYVLTGWFIGMQDTRTPMVVSITQNVINILASLLLVFGFGMQIEGVALGTLIAQWSGVALYLFFLRRQGGKEARSQDNGLRSQGGKEARKQDNTSENRGGQGKRLGSLTPWLLGSLEQTSTLGSLFLRTLCLVAVNLFFTSAGARQGDLMLSVNTLLMTFFTLFSYVMDGFANAGEALCGKLYGEGEHLRSQGAEEARKSEERGERKEERVYSSLSEGGYRHGNCHDVLAGRSRPLWRSLSSLLSPLSSEDTKRDGGGSQGTFPSLLRHLFRWGWLMSAVFTLVYAVGGRGFLGLLTDEAAVVDAAMTYLPWALLIPVAGMAAFVYDGIFIGLLDTHGMLASCAVATAAFFVLHFALFPHWGNYALWLALIVYLALRGLLQHRWLRRRMAT